ncbi:OmpA family protein [Salipiger sp. P9]|uniref:OmpA family protein n=1 Tax=Salipiger pentaromativorans TaxID=2943193 RepID=UPI002156F9B1|nr:OmpA family protein [Salipiger pentaromativorans]MCR8548425.1 OmpA family protein [Salipiger pentaromativorans]
MTPITRSFAEAALLLICLAGPLQALDLSLPSGARMMAERVTDPGSYAVPLGPWREDGGSPVIRAEGRIARQAWRIDASDLTTLQILAPLRDQILAAGYELLFDCASARCGGFDFRFGTEVIPAPEMYVDLTAFRFLAARGPEGDYLTLLVSRSNAAGYVQIIRAGAGAPTRIVPDGAVPIPAAATEGIAAELEAQGHAILRDLRFESGATALGDATIASLDALAAYLRDNPTRRILFVGHTDAVGSLDANTALSRKRAAAAEAYLRDRDIPAAQIGSDGVGYLAPVASNLTQEGREENRRVEAVLISTD